MESFFMKLNIRSLVLIPALLGLFAGVALADDNAGKPGSAPNHQQWCADNPQKCQEMKTRMQEKCAQDPKRCEEMKARMAERKAKCKANPEECQKQREQMKAHRAEMRAKCEANPEECKKRREEMREHREKCRENPDSCRRPERDKAPAEKPST
jgi:hypothetical protein